MINRQFVSRCHELGLLTAGPVMIIIVVIITGCNGQTKVTHQDVLSHYQAGQYDQAFAAAVQLHDKTTGKTRNHAKYLAGISAYKTGEYDQAIKYLTPLARVTDPDLSGKANATLGLIYCHRNEDIRALRHFVAAIGKLNGFDAANALYYQGLVEQKLGWWSSARGHLRAALSQATDSVLRDAIRQRLSADSFTLQLGAYSQRASADKRVNVIQRLAKSTAIGTPVIIPTLNDKGGRLYIVQAGRFTSYATADQARQKLNDPDAWIATMAVKAAKH